MLPLEAVFCPCCGPALLHSLVLHRNNLMLQGSNLVVKQSKLTLKQHSLGSKHFSQLLQQNNPLLRQALPPWSHRLRLGKAGSSRPSATAPSVELPLPARQPQNLDPA